MLVNEIDKLEQGFKIDTFGIKTKNLAGSRYKEERNNDVTIYKDNHVSHLLFTMVFLGRKLHYRPWIGLFNIHEALEIGNASIPYIDLLLEQSLITFFTRILEPGENIFVEYYRDTQTRKQLERSAPPPLTRFGYILYNSGFFWFKDWYFPERYMEGEQKLQD